MKIVIAAHHFPPRYVSGGEKDAFRIAKGLQDRGHTVQVVCVEEIVQGPQGRLEYEDTTYEGLQVRRLSYCLASAPDTWLWSYNNPWIGDHLRSFLLEQKPDLFLLVSGYLMTASVLFAAKDCGVRTALYLTDLWFLCARINMLQPDGRISTLPIQSATCARCIGEEKRRYRWLGKALPTVMDWFWSRQVESIKRIEQRSKTLKEAIGLVDLVISPSRFLSSMYEKAGYLAKPAVFIRQGLSQIPERASWSSSVPEPGAALRVGYIGQIASHKGVHVLVEAVRSLKDANLLLTIYGDETTFPDYTSQLRHKIGADERIHLAGVFKGAERLQEIMRSLDVVVVPSVCYENSPLAILEAFSFGVPVVASDFSGMAELVQNGIDGLLFRLGDASDLARQLKKLQDAPELISKLRDNIQPVKRISEQIDEVERLFVQLSA